jgi:alkyl sulfatase BDS1-like metallo-beta-lactamase superfamily hydrolase
VIQRFLGFWDCNPATLIPLSPEDSAPLYVEMMGGAAAILARADALHQAGDYKLEVEILNKLVQAEPDNGAAKDMLADAFEQIGYQQENPGLRNSFLASPSRWTRAGPRGSPS